MKRRDFLRAVVMAGAACVLPRVEKGAEAADGRGRRPAPTASGRRIRGRGAKLFPTDLPACQWVEFRAAGFSAPVSGVIFRPDKPPCCGMPLGGVATGCLDIDARGVLGFNALFNMLYPETAFAGHRGNVFPGPLTRKLPDHAPFLGVTVGETTWVLASQEILDGGTLETCVDPVFIDRKETVELPPVSGVRAAKQIHYWGHYPIADMEYELDGPSGRAPLSVGLRAWAPFIPGDIDASGAPCAFFEVHLRNETDDPQQGTLAFSFPGPVPPKFEGTLRYMGQATMDFPDTVFPPPTKHVTRQPFSAGSLLGVEVSDGSHSYVIGALGRQPGRQMVRRGGRLGVRSWRGSAAPASAGPWRVEQRHQQDVSFGGELGRHGNAWAGIGRHLPLSVESERGASVAVKFALGPRERTTIRFVLAWYAPEWQGRREHRYTTVYSKRFGSARDVAERMGPHREALLWRVLAWQVVIYSEKRLPPWLRDCLINNLALIPETTWWAVAKPPLGDWCYEDGFFGMLESPRGCPQIECNPCTFYGNLPIVYFFPELARSQLEGHRHYTRDDGAVPFVIGSWGPPDMASPHCEWQIALNGPVYAILADRLWQRTGDDAVLREFYPSVKKNAIFTMNLRPTPEGVISMPAGNVGMEWFEWGEWLGMCSHIGGIRLATVRIIERMAEAMGDAEFAAQCRLWFENGSRAMEEKMWTGSYYLNFYDEELGRKSEAVMGYQLDGEMIADLHGVPGAYRADRIPVVLDTIRRCNMPFVVCGAASFATPDGQPLGPDEKIVAYGSTFIFLPEIMMLAANYVYEGQREFGLEFLRKAMEYQVCVHRHPWDLPNLIMGDTGERRFGTDYYQNMMLWALPAALAGQDIRALCSPGGLVGRVLQAGSNEPRAARDDG